MLNKTPSWRTIIAEIIDECGGNGKTAKAVAIKRAETDTLFRDDLVRIGADQAVRSYFQNGRHNRSSKYGINSTERERRVIEKQERRLFWERYSLFGQQMLFNATRKELILSVENRRRQAAGNLSCASFEEAIAKLLKDDETVGASLPIETVIKLAKKHHVVPAEWKI